VAELAPLQRTLAHHFLDALQLSSYQESDLTDFGDRRLYGLAPASSVSGPKPGRAARGCS